MSLVVTGTNWAVHEFADADLGDERRTTRLVELASALGQHPTAALPEACCTGSMLKAAYRFFHIDGIAPQDILHSHVPAAQAPAPSRQAACTGYARRQLQARPFPYQAQVARLRR